LLARNGCALGAPLLLCVRAADQIAQLRVVRRVLHRSLIFGNLPLAQCSVRIAEIQAGDAEPEVRRISEDLIAHARRRILFGYFLDRVLQRLRPRLILARADEIDAAVVSVRPSFRRDRGKSKQQQKHRAFHGAPPASWGSVAVAGSANATLSNCSWPAFTSTLRVIGERNAG